MATAVAESPTVAVGAGLNPFTVTVTTRDGCDVVEVHRVLIGMAEACAMTGLSRTEIRRLLRFRRQRFEAGSRSLPHHVPAPLNRNDKDPVWERVVFATWARRVGLYVEGHRGRPIIGYTGLALLLDMTEQGLRVAAVAPGTLPFPPSVLEIIREAMTINFFDFEASIQWCVWTRRLAPDVDAHQLLRNKITKG